MHLSDAREVRVDAPEEFVIVETVTASNGPERAMVRGPRAGRRSSVVTAVVGFALLLAACGGSGPSALTINSGKAKDLVSETNSVFHCEGKTYSPSGSRNGDALFCDLKGDTQLHFNVWSPKYDNAQGVDQLRQQCQAISNSTEITSASNYAFVGKNWVITEGGTLSASQANALRKLAKVEVYDCAG